MDPNAAVAALRDARQELQDARAAGMSASVLRDLEEEFAERRQNLRDWKRSGGFAPDGGWPRNV